MPSGFAKLGCREWAGRSITIVPWSAAASGGGLQLLENTTPTYWSYFGIFWYILVSSEVIITMLLLVRWDFLAIHIPKIGRGRGFRLQSTREKVGWVMFEHTTIHWFGIHKWNTCCPFIHWSSKKESLWWYLFSNERMLKWLSDQVAACLTAFISD